MRSCKNDILAASNSLIISHSCIARNCNWRGYWIQARKGSAKFVFNQSCILMYMYFIRNLPSLVSKLYGYVMLAMKFVRTLNCILMNFITFSRKRKSCGFTRGNLDKKVQHRSWHTAKCNIL